LHLILLKHVGKTIIHPSGSSSSSSFLFLLDVAKGISSLILRERRNDSNQLSFNLARDTRNTRTWVLSENTRTTVPFSFRLVESATLSDCSSKATPCTRCVFSIRRVEGISTPRSNQVMSFPITIFSVCAQYVQSLNHHYHTSATLGIF
jgi:hypothetical protein